MKKNNDEEIIMKVLNLFAGPGAGKSTTAAGRVQYLKLADGSCELITEVAKALQASGRSSMGAF
jgi:hypothetical protein